MNFDVQQNLCIELKFNQKLNMLRWDDENKLDYQT